MDGWALASSTNQPKQNRGSLGIICCRMCGQAPALQRLYACVACAAVSYHLYAATHLTEQWTSIAQSSSAARTEKMASRTSLKFGARDCHGFLVSLLGRTDKNKRKLWG